MKNKSSKPVAIMCFSGGMGGMEHDSVKLANRLSDSFEVVLFCKQGSFIQELARRYSGNFLCEGVSFSSTAFSIAMLVRVRQLLRKRGIGNVIFFGASELKTLHFAFLGFDLNIIVRHGTTKSKSKNDWLHRLVYSQVNYHVALSRHLLKNVRKIVPPTKGVKYRIIFPSFEFADVRPEPKADCRELVITHVGRIAPAKGQLDAVCACGALADAGIDFRLNLLGGVEGENTEREIQQAIEHRGLGDKVSLRGHVKYVSDVLAASDIFLFPSYGEGMANAFIEALHFGLPCLAYNNTVFPEFIDMGFHLTLAEDRDIDDLSAKLLFIVRNIDEEKERAGANIGLATDYFNIEREKVSWADILV
ncbi:MAG: glycosyltransferase family 4 protein [Thiotrichales bacterium]|nr:MAG: glycosyltransferase family 4 protein [Thiotrichales bacterium]